MTTPTQHRSIRPAVAISAAMLLAAAGTAPAYAAAGDHETGKRAETGKPVGHNPTGNNGTVFIHDVAGDHAPHNVPHVSCEFWVDLFGFDAGQQVTVSFAGQAPTGKDVPLNGTWTGTVSDDDAGGAGNDFDLELAFTADDLGVTQLGAPHPQQGYHVKMTVETGEPGGHKYKVFWIEPCATEQAPVVETPSEETPEVGGSSEGGTVGGGTQGGTTHTATPKAQGRVVVRQPATPSPQVLGRHLTRAPQTQAGASAASLPFTGPGVPVALLTWLAAGAVALGSALTVVSRRRRDTA